MVQEKNTSSAAVDKVIDIRVKPEYDRVCMIVTGFHSIEEKVLACTQRGDEKGKEPKHSKLFYSKPGPRVKKILEKAKQSGIASEQVDDKKLNELVEALPESLRDHRGLVMIIDDEKQADEIARLQ